MRPDGWSLIPMVLGLALFAAGFADGHELLTKAREDGWWLFVRTECELYGGLWLFAGLAPRWARVSALTAFVGVLACDLARAAVGYPPRAAFGPVAIGSWWVPASDLVILLVLYRWRPAAGRVARVDSHPVQVIGVAALAAALGVAIDWLQVGRFPIVVTASAGPSGPSPGLAYLVYLPDGYSLSAGRWPLIIYLHGSGNVGRAIDSVRVGGLPRRIEAGRRIPFITVAPHSPTTNWDVVALDALLGELLRRYRVDADRVYLTGVSMGGYGAWELATAYPERFAAVAPVCGGGDPASAHRLRGVPIWAFHGAEDTLVPLKESREMVAALERAGGDVRLTIYPGVGHDAGSPTYAGRGLYDWFLAHRRRAGGPVGGTTASATPASPG